MPRFDYAIMMVAGTLAIVSTFVLAFLMIRDRLARDPDLQEFMQRVEQGRSDEEHSEAGDSGQPDDSDDDPTTGSSARRGEPPR